MLKCNITAVTNHDNDSNGSKIADDDSGDGSNNCNNWARWCNLVQVGRDYTGEPLKIRKFLLSR
jgi:hypothetical protein